MAKTRKQAALIRAIELRGGLTGLADAMNTKPQVIWNWRNRGVPAERCREVEMATGGKVRCEELRPDVFGKAA